MSNLQTMKRSIPISVQRQTSPFFSLQRELDRTMNDFYNRFEANQFPMTNLENIAITPAIDIVEDKQSFKVEAEMPGMGENDIQVSISDGMLTIKGEKTVSSKDEGKNYLSREIGYGCYERRIALPESVEVDKAKATFKKGMLWVNFPKKAESIKKSRDLPVEKASN